MAFEITGQRVALSFNLPALNGSGRALLAMAFLAGCWLYVSLAGGITVQGLMGSQGLAVLVGGYMAMNIGANDVANAVGPLAAIYQGLGDGAIAAKAATPLWVLVLGALGLSLGLMLYGGKLIRTVGHGITELDALRVYAITMASALTVIVASHLGMPISTTHVAIGAVFGVGLLREAIKRRRGVQAGDGRLVDRRAALRIVAAWLVTVPATALVGAGLFHVIRALA